MKKEVTFFLLVLSVHTTYAQYSGLPVEGTTNSSTGNVGIGINTYITSLPRISPGLLLMKIEELTLYMIDMKKQNEILTKRVQRLENK